jgi:hypothetical protein
MEPSDFKKFIADLSEWRLNKKKKTDRLPSSFWERALALDKKYPNLFVRERCKLNSIQWKRHKENKSPTPLPRHFLELPDQAPVLNQSCQSPQVTLELKLPSGITVRFF